MIHPLHLAAIRSAERQAAPLGSATWLRVGPGGPVGHGLMSWGDRVTWSADILRRFRAMYTFVRRRA